MGEKKERYFLVIYTDILFLEPTLMIDSILRLNKVSNTDAYFKYVYGDTHLVCHFETSFDYQTLIKTISNALKNVTQYFLFKETPETFAVLPHSLYDALFNLDSDTENTDRLFDFDDNYDYINSDDNEEDAELELLMNLSASKQRPNLDELLEKINEQGINKLTEEEIKHLEAYAQEREQE